MKHVINHAIECKSGIAGGKPLLKSVCVPTKIIAERFKGGESIKQLAMDYNCPDSEIAEAIRFEL